jgi:hypothetical protein
MGSKFDGQKLITCGIEHALPPNVTMLLWQLVVAHVYSSDYNRREVDYLQVFELKADKKRPQMLIVEHRQEQPEYKETHHYRLSNPKVLEQIDGITVFVIDDVTHATMLLPEEY